MDSPSNQGRVEPVLKDYLEKSSKDTEKVLWTV